MADQHRSQFTAPDVQAQLPTVHVALSRVGVTGVEKVIRIAPDGSGAALPRAPRVLRRPRPAPEGRAHVALRGGRQRGDRRGHARRVGASAPRRWPSTSPSSCASARRPRRAEVTIAARYPEHKPAPVSGIQTQEIYTLLRLAPSPAQRGTRRLVGVAAQGMTACPCAQELVAGRAARAARRPTASPTTRSSGSSSTSPSPPTTSAASARCYIGCTEACDDEIDAADAAARSSRARCPRRSTS